MGGDHQTAQDTRAVVGNLAVLAGEDNLAVLAGEDILAVLAGEDILAVPGGEALAGWCRAVRG